MSKHTPGPWAFARHSKKRFGLGQRGSGPFFFLQCVDDDTETPQSWADARLIAAAPVLLEALYEIADAGIGSVAPGYAEIARAAIAKAGEAK